jgi:hypothetical protein
MQYKWQCVRQLHAFWVPCEPLSNGRMLAFIIAFEASQRPFSCGVLFPFLFIFSFFSGRVSCWPLKSILSFYFITFHIWPSMFWFISLIFSFFFIKFQFIFNFIFESIILIFNFLKFGPYFLCFYFLFGFFCKFYHLI